MVRSYYSPTNSLIPYNTERARKREGVITVVTLNIFVSITVLLFLFKKATTGANNVRSIATHAYLSYSDDEIEEVNFYFLN